MALYMVYMIYSLVLALLSTPLIYAANTLVGNSGAAAGETFSFRIQGHVQGTTGANTFISAHPSDGNSAKEFAVAQIEAANNQFTPLAVEKVLLDGKKDQTNPLYSQGVAFLALLEGAGAVMGSPERPVVVTQSDLVSIYLINSITKNTIEMASARGIPDANGNLTSGIVGLGAGNVFVFSAVRPAGGGAFGDAGSGIALVILFATQNSAVFSVFDGPTGILGSTRRAVPLDRTSSQVTIGADLASMTITDFHWNPFLNRIYIALQVQGGAGATNGARALLVGRVEKSGNNYPLLLTSIVPDAALSGTQNKIIGAQGANAQISIHKVRSMFTSTALHYLIVLGDNGAASATQKNVYALPLVSFTGDSSINGTIANKNSLPEDHFSTVNDTPMFEFRNIKTPATVAADMTTNTDIAAQVGGGALAAGDITDMLVRGDTVFVTVQTAATNYKPGIFYSQALFDNTGKIKAWTEWRRAATTYNQSTGDIDKTFGVAIDFNRGNVLALVANNSDEIKIAKRTSWATGDANGMLPLVRVLTSMFYPEIAGIQGIFDFNFNASGLKDIAALVLTGLNKIVIVESGRKVGSAFVPNGGSAFNGVESFADGSITQDFPPTSARIVSISGGALDLIGPIIAAEFARNGSLATSGWLFIGGSGGLAVLSKADGTGWNPATQLGTGLSGLTNGMSFKKIGNYSFVRKIINDGNYLYVLTDTTFDRIDLTQGNVGLGTIVKVTLATPQDLRGVGTRGTLLDALVSEKFALLGTSTGLLRVGNSRDIRTATNPSDVGWTIVGVPEGVNAILKLIPVTRTGFPTDVTDSISGQLYALSSYRGFAQARINRYTINSVEGTAINDTTIQPLPDLYVKNILSFFISFGMLRTLFASDGALYFSAQSKDLNQSPLLSLLMASIDPLTGMQFDARSGVRFLGIKSIQVAVNITGAALISALTKNSASGSWLIGGDFGMRINE